jgi:hypothetical protein
MTTQSKTLRFISLAVAAMTLLGFAVYARAEDAPKPAPEKPKPSISTEQRAAFWRATLEATQATAAKQAADAKQKSIVDDMTKSCGAWQLQLDQKSGEPACIEPPKVEEKAK